MNEPEVKFFSGDKMIVSCGLVTVECQYWVQWGEQIWNVEITGVTGKPDDDASVAEIVACALRKPDGKLILKRGNELLCGPSKPPVSSSVGKVI